MTKPSDHPGRPDTASGWSRFLTPLNLLLLAVPATVGLKVAGVGGAWMFAVAGLAIVPLAGLIGKATEVLAKRTGSGIGGLLNATFGNATELIIAIVILSRGPGLYPVVKATLTGSIIGNLLLVLGAALLAGGFRHREQSFNATAAGVGATLLAIAAAGLLVPTLFYFLPHPGDAAADTRRVENLSEEIAVILVIVYGLSLWFSLRTHRHLYGGNAGDSDGGPKHDGPGWGVWPAVGVLCGATAAVAVLSEWLVGAIEPAARALGMNDVFIGVVVVAVVGNAAEHFSAVQMAWRKRTDVAVQIAISSSTQIALFVAPVLVFRQPVHGPPPPTRPALQPARSGGRGAERGGRGARRPRRGGELAGGGDAPGPVRDPRPRLLQPADRGGLTIRSGYEGKRDGS